MMRMSLLRRPKPGRFLATAAGLLLHVAGPAAAQLRPLDPLVWEVLQPDRSFSGAMGVGVHQDQRASLAGTTGRLMELGNFQLTWRSGRIAVEAAGTVRRILEEEDRFANPAGGARAGLGRRSDSGDYRLATTVVLTPARQPADPVVVARFGTRLPTTDNRVGLERDQTDFFGLLGARTSRGRLALEGETGIGIYGTRDLNFEQSDLWLYSIAARFRDGRVSSVLTILGQMDWSAGEPVRSNEDLAELRAAVSFGTRRWLRAEAVKGLTPFSPSAGLLLSAGVTR